MNSRGLSIIALVALIAVQIYAPLSMILDKEDVLANGKPYKFRIKPVDPNDPLRGKYLTLSFNADEFAVKDKEEWRRDDVIYVVLSEDSSGFAMVDTVFKNCPVRGVDYVKAKVSYTAYDDRAVAFINYPFDRYYMDEFKAPGAEISYDEAGSDSAQTAYAVVCIKDGDAVVKDLMINQVSINEMVKKNQK
jgi:uncharacterized membrane-anchored protein